MSCKEGMRVENLEQKVIRAGYEENTEDFQAAQTFRDIFHCPASQSPCLRVWAAWRGPGFALWAALQPGSRWERAGITTNEAFQMFPSKGTGLYLLSLALIAL